MLLWVKPHFALRLVKQYVPPSIDHVVIYPVLRINTLKPISDASAAMMSRTSVRVPKCTSSLVALYDPCNRRKTRSAGGTGTTAKTGGERKRERRTTSAAGEKEKAVGQPSAKRAKKYARKTCCHHDGPTAKQRLARMETELAEVRMKLAQEQERPSQRTANEARISTAQGSAADPAPARTGAAGDVVASAPVSTGAARGNVATSAQMQAVVAAGKVVASVPMQAVAVARNAVASAPVPMRMAPGNAAASAPVETVAATGNVAASAPVETRPAAGQKQDSTALEGDDSRTISERDLILI